MGAIWPMSNYLKFAPTTSRSSNPGSGPQGMNLGLAGMNPGHTLFSYVFDSPNSLINFFSFFLKNLDSTMQYVEKGDVRNSFFRFLGSDFVLLIFKKMNFKTISLILPPISIYCISGEEDIHNLFPSFNIFISSSLLPYYLLVINVEVS